MKTSMGYAHRRSVRLELDYASNQIFFVTICAYRRQCTFASIIDNQVALSPLGNIVRAEWERTTIVRPEVRLGAFVIMPNHLHGLLFIPERPEARDARRASLRAGRNLPGMVGGFKSSVRRQAAERLGWSDPVWQPRYYEHVVRNIEDLERVERYIAENPQRWSHDPENNERRS